MKRLLRALGQLVRKEIPMPDMEDALVFGGISAACYGIAQVYSPAAWVAGGAALFWLGIRRL